MRSEYNQEIVRRILRYGPEQAGNRDLVCVGLHHKINDDREGYKVCEIVRVGVSFQMKDERNFAPYTRDMVVNTISKVLCRETRHNI